MIRFRHREDEVRYLKMLSDVYRRVAAHLPPSQVTPVLRNLGKLQDMLWLEGIRQGVAVTAIANMGEKADGDATLESLKAFQLHAHVYGSQDTPLRDVEEEWMEKLGFKGYGHPWLDEEPMRFAPDTEAAFEAVQAAEAAQQTSRAIESLPEVGDDGEPVIPKFVSEALDEGDIDFEGEGAQEEPDVLDRVRDELIRMHALGVKPRDYSDLVLRLHMNMQMDAAYLDMQLGTDMGRTVLSQAGYGEYYPGPFGLNVTEITERASEMLTNSGEHISDHDRREQQDD